MFLPIVGHAKKNYFIAHGLNGKGEGMTSCVEKICPKCGIVKSLDSFYLRRRNGKTSPTSYCKSCVSILQRDWQFKNKWRRLKHKYNKLYGLSDTEIEDMVKSQNYLCAICKSSCEREFLSLDHDHETGEVRGFLCNNCNTGLGKFKDNVDVLEAAIDYLRSKTSS